MRGGEPVASGETTDLLVPAARALAGNIALDDALRELLAHSLDPLGASAVVVCLINTEGLLSVTASCGVARETLARFEPMTVSESLPISHAVMTGEPVWISSLTERDLRYPALAGTFVENQATASLPLRFGDQVIGALGIVFPSVTELSDPVKRQLEVVAEMLASTLGRTRIDQGRDLDLALEGPEARAVLFVRNRASTFLAYVLAFGLPVAIGLALRASADPAVYLPSSWFVGVVILCAVLGGVRPAALAACVSVLGLWLSVVQRYEERLSPRDAVAAALFLAVAAGVLWLFNRLDRSSRQIQRARLSAEVAARRSNRMLAITRDLAAPISEDQVYEAVLAGCFGGTVAEAGLMVVGASDDCRIEAMEGFDRSTEARLRIAAASAPGRLTTPLETRRPLVQAQADDLGLLGGGTVARGTHGARLGCWASFPIAAGEEPVAVLHVASRGAFGVDDRIYLATIARLGGQALERIRLLRDQGDVLARAELTDEQARLTTELETAQRIAGVGSWELTHDHFSWSKQMSRIFGLPPELEVSDPEDVRPFIHPDDAGGLMEVQRRVLDEGGPVVMEIALTRPDGDKRITSVTAEPVLGSDGTIVGVRGITLDITEARRAEEELAEAREELWNSEVARFREHELVDALQAAALPSILPKLDGFEIAASYVPAVADLTIGGDWYDAFERGDGKVVVSVGDVSGHGVEAAVLMSQLRHSLRAYAVESLPAGELLGRLNRLLCSHETDAFATAVVAVIDPDTREVELSHAGHPPPVLFGERSAQLLELEGCGGTLLGVWEDVDYAARQLLLPPGTGLLLYTDGLVERRGESIDDGLDRLVSLLNGQDVYRVDLAALLESVTASLLTGEIRDDSCQLAVLSCPPDA